jgi:hypothetical protein
MKTVTWRRETRFYEISGSRGGEYENNCLLGHCAIIALIMEEKNTSETSANLYQTKRRNISEDSHVRTKFYQKEMYC